MRCTWFRGSLSMYQFHKYMVHHCPDFTDDIIWISGVAVDLIAKHHCALVCVVNPRQQLINKLHEGQSHITLIIRITDKVRLHLFHINID